MRITNAKEIKRGDTMTVPNGATYTVESVNGEERKIGFAHPYFGGGDANCPNAAFMQAMMDSGACVIERPLTKLEIYEKWVARIFQDVPNIEAHANLVQWGEGLESELEGATK